MLAGTLGEVEVEAVEGEVEGEEEVLGREEWRVGVGVVVEVDIMGEGGERSREGR